MLALGAIAAELIPLAVSAISGGGGSATACPGQPNPELTRQVLTAASAADRAELVRLWGAFSDGRGTSRPIYLSGNLAIDPASFSFEAWGGKDCKVSSAEGRALYGFVQTLLAKYAGATASGAVLAPAGGVLGTVGTILQTGAQAGVDSVLKETAKEVSKDTNVTVLPDWVPYALGGVAIVAVIMLIRK